MVPASADGPALEDLRASGEEIERLLARLGELPERRAREWAEALLRVVTDLYGAGLARIVELAGELDAGAVLLERMAGDDLVASLLVLHDLHPLGMQARVERALGRLGGPPGRPLAVLTRLDEQAGVAWVELGEVAGGASALDLLEAGVHRVLGAEVPELTRVEVGRPLLASPVRFLGKHAAAARR